MGALRNRQRAVGGQSVHGAEQGSDLLWVGCGEQPQIDGMKRQVTTEREEPQPGVPVDVALADLDEPSTEGQQFQPGR